MGKVHKKEHFYMVIKGAVRVSDGEVHIDYFAPTILVCSPGTKRAVYALEDSVCITVHRTEFNELEAIENDLVEDDPDSMYLPGNIVKEGLLT